MFLGHLLKIFGATWGGVWDVFQEVFGEKGRHARAAVGVIALPLGATVEIELMARFSPRER